MAKGGARPGAGRPRGSPNRIQMATIEAARGDAENAVAYLRSLMLDTSVDVTRRDRAAVVLASIENRWQRPIGKKQADEERARTCHLNTEWEHLLPPDIPAVYRARPDVSQRPDKFRTPDPPGTPSWDELLSDRHYEDPGEC